MQMQPTERVASYNRFIFCMNDLVNTSSSTYVHYKAELTTTQIFFCDSKIAYTAWQPPNNQWITFLKELVSQALYVPLVWITRVIQI